MTDSEAQISSCRAMIERFGGWQREAAHQSAGQRAKVLEEIAAVTRSIQGVDEIARTTKILSINVSIEAARAGDAGKGFSVLAREIRELAASTQALAAEVGARIEALARVITVDLADAAKRHDVAEHEAFDEFSHKLASFSDDANAILSHERATLDQLGRVEEAISSPILEAIGKMQFQDIIRQQLEQVEQSIAMVDEHIADLSAALSEHRAPASDNLWAKFEGQFGTYRMDDQRASHRAASGQADEGMTAPMIELF